MNKIRLMHWLVIFPLALALCSCTPIQVGMHAAKDGHKYDVGSVEIDLSHGPKRFELKYDCEERCDQEGMIHNAQDMLEICLDNLNRKHYKQFLVSTSKPPHERGQYDSEFLFEKSNEGKWNLIGKKFNGPGHQLSNKPWRELPPSYA